MKDDKLGVIALLALAGLGQLLSCGDDVATSNAQLRGGELEGSWPLLSSDAIISTAADGIAIGSFQRKAPETSDDKGGAGERLAALDGLLFTFTERVPDTSMLSGVREFTFDRGPYPYDYVFASLSARSSHEAFAGGTTTTGEGVIERWILPPETGGYYTSRESYAGTQIGVPLPVANISLDLVGGAYVEPKDRSSSPPYRDVLYRGPQLAGLRCVVADPEDRFVLVLGRDGSLFRVDYASGSPVVPVLLFSATAQGIPELAKCYYGRVYQHPTQGRVYHFNSPSSDPMPCDVLLFDGENDGVFENTIVYTRSEFLASPYYACSWLDDFRTYRFAAGSRALSTEGGAKRRDR